MAQEQLPPEMMAEAIPAEMGLPPEIPALPGEEIPMVPGEEVVEEVVEEGIMGGPIQSNALQTDPAKADASATRIVTGAKAQMYGDQFDKFMEVLQNSQNIAEDAAMISQSLLLPEIQAAATTDRGIPIDHMMDVTAEVVSEVLDMATQTGTYAPNSEEEAMRVNNIATTMTMGELGKQLAASQIIPEDDVAQFMENVMGGRYDSPEAQRSLLEEPEMPPEMPV
tara:strand:+ start:640 stop:1311 length:672 start_codon:yes stop_codon:yes gene_type:complete